MVIEGEGIRGLIPFEGLEEEEKEVRAELRRNIVDEDLHSEEMNIEDNYVPKHADEDDYPYPTGYNENTVLLLNMIRCLNPNFTTAN